MLFLAIALGIGAVIILLWLDSLRRCPLVFDPDPTLLDRGRVSLVIPMYNEERNVDGVLAAVRAQTHPALEVIAVNDRSSDGTAAKLAEWQARWTELRVITIDHHPEDWTGKSYPMHRGAEVATGDWLLFLDADIRLAPESVARTVGACQARGWAALSILGRLCYSTFWERVLHVNLAALYLILVVESPQTVMCGHYMLVRRDIYQAVGGWSMVRDEMQDDVALPRLLSENGYLSRTRVWLESHTVGAYRDVPELWRAMRRMVAGGNGFRPGYSAIPALFGLLAHLGPWVVLIAGVVGRWWRNPTGSVVIGLAAADLIFLMASYFRLSRILGTKWWVALTRPLGDLLAFGVQADAALRAAFGSLEWKGIAFGFRRGFPERPEEVPDLLEFYLSMAVSGMTQAWIARMAMQTERLRFSLRKLDHRPMSSGAFERFQPLMTVRHAIRLTARHWKQLRSGLELRGMKPGAGWFIGCLSWGWLLAQLAIWCPPWLRWRAKRRGVTPPRYQDLSPDEQRKVRAEAFLCLEQQHRPWFNATPPDRKPAVRAEVERAASPAAR